jgi:hypothetical protein
MRCDVVDIDRAPDKPVDMPVEVNERVEDYSAFWNGGDALDGQRNLSD